MICMHEVKVYTYVDGCRDKAMSVRMKLKLRSTYQLS